MKTGSVLTYSCSIFIAFAAGVAVSFFISFEIGNRSHAREETKMAQLNRKLAIERGDKSLQGYFEEVIIWNTVNHLSPAYHNHEPLVIDDSWIFPDPDTNDYLYHRSKGDWEDSDLIRIGIEQGLLSFERQKSAPDSRERFEK